MVGGTMCGEEKEKANRITVYAFLYLIRDICY